MDGKLLQRLEGNISRVENDLPLAAKIRALIKAEEGNIVRHRQDLKLFRKRGLTHLCLACNDKINRSEYTITQMQSLL